MSNTPNDLHYTASHEWVKTEDDGTVTVGISDHAQALLGDLVFVELPEVGHTGSTGEDCAVVESVKAASDVYFPLDGEITEVNEDLEGDPSLVNTAPYDGGWLFRLRPQNAEDIQHLLEAEAYAAQLEG